MRRGHMNKKLQKILNATGYQFKNIKYAFTSDGTDSKAWLISENGNDAQDNGFALYKYLVQNQDMWDIHAVYVISKDSPDYQKVASLGGDIVEPDTKRHYQLMYSAGALISTHTYGYTPNKEIYYQLAQAGMFGPLDSLNVFLQHGVLDKDCEWLHWENYQPDLFCISTPFEYQVLEEIYGVPKENIMATGMPRYDNLTSIKNDEKTILIMPTWRQWLKDATKEEFKNSVYFRKWKQIFGSELFKQLLEKNGYKCIYYLHSEIQRFAPLFTPYENPVIHFETKEIQECMKKSDMLITDYSSIYLDMLHMKKPVFFYQFDRKQYESKHYSRSLLDYSDYGAMLTEDNFIKILSRAFNGERFGDEEKIDSLFYFYDTNQCFRIVQRIQQSLN